MPLLCLLAVLLRMTTCVDVSFVVVIWNQYKGNFSKLLTTSGLCKNVWLSDLVIAIKMEASQLFRVELCCSFARNLSMFLPFLICPWKLTVKNWKFSVNPNLFSFTLARSLTFLLGVNMIYYGDSPLWCHIDKRNRGSNEKCHCRNLRQNICVTQ